MEWSRPWRGTNAIFLPLVLTDRDVVGRRPVRCENLDFLDSLENVWIVDSRATDDSDFRVILNFAHFDEHPNQVYFAVALLQIPLDLY